MQFVQIFTQARKGGELNRVKPLVYLVNWAVQPDFDRFLTGPTKQWFYGPQRIGPWSVSRVNRSDRPDRCGPISVTLIIAYGTGPPVLR